MNTFRNALIGALLSSSLAACGGGGSSPMPATMATSAPVIVALPSVTPSPTPGSIATPTAAPLAKHVDIAPAQVYTTTGIQSVSRSVVESRRTQSVSLLNSTPVLVGSYSPWWPQLATNFFSWVQDSAGNPVAETALSISSDKFVPVSASLDQTNAFGLAYHDYLDSATPTQTGLSHVSLAYADGTTVAAPLYVYDGWNAACSPSSGFISTFGGWSYVSGQLISVSSSTDDMAVNCSTFTLNFAHGAVRIASPQSDPWGSIATQFTTILSPSAGTAVTSIPIASVQPGEVYIVSLGDGGTAKVMPLVSTGTTLIPNFSGIALHSQANASYAY